MTERSFRLLAENSVWLLITIILIGVWFWSMTAFVVLISMLVAGIAAKLSVLLTIGPKDGA